MYYKLIAQLFRRSVIPLDVILISAALEPTHNNSCDPSFLPNLMPLSYIGHIIRNNNRITKIR